MPFILRGWPYAPPPQDDGLLLHPQPLHEVGADADRIAIARGAGIANSAWAADEDDFDRLVAAALNDGGPSLIAARVDGKPAVATTDRDPVRIRANFMQGLGGK